jgi:alanine dehydrogenase
MNIGIPRETAARGKELRAILLPPEVKKIINAGHRVLAEKGLGAGIYLSDSEYKKSGASITRDRQKIFSQDIVAKLKPPLPGEFKMLKNNILFSMLHAEQNPRYIKMLRQRKARAIAMELIKNRAGQRLIHCTDMAGEQGMLMAFHLAKKIPAECNVLVLGYGEIASGALRTAFNLGAKVKILRKSEYKQIRHFLKDKDIVVNGIYWPKQRRDKKQYLITRDMLSLMNKGGLILDLSVDYPNPIQTCHPTLINEPTYIINDILHISIFGYPGLAPISSARRYSRQVLPVLLKISSRPIDKLPSYIKRAVINPDNY